MTANAPARLVVKPREPTKPPQRDRLIADLNVGEIGYAIPNALSINDHYAIRVRSFGAATMGVMRTAEGTYEVWLEESPSTTGD